MRGRVTMGQYVPGPSPVHQLDARTKIGGTLLYGVLLLLARGAGGLAACAAFTALSLAAARVPWAPLWRGLRPIFWLVLLTVGLDAVLIPGRVLYHLGPVVVTARGLHLGLSTGIRLGLLVAQATVLTASTLPLELSSGAERLLRPFRRLGVPAHELALMSSIALRFIPTFTEEAERIQKAQSARGADFGGSLAARWRAGVALLVPLLLGALRRADDLALAMEARGYRGEEGRTSWRPSRVDRGDLVVAGLMSVLAAAVLWSLVSAGGR